MASRSRRPTIRASASCVQLGVGEPAAEQRRCCWSQTTPAMLAPSSRWWEVLMPLLCRSIRLYLVYRGLSILAKPRLPRPITDQRAASRDTDASVGAAYPGGVGEKSNTCSRAPADVGSRAVPEKRRTELLRGLSERTFTDLSYGPSGLRQRLDEHRAEILEIAARYGARNVRVSARLAAGRTRPRATSTCSSSYPRARRCSIWPASPKSLRA